MPSKAQITQAIQTYADASGNLELRASLGDPSLGPIWIRGESVDTGKAYTIPGFTDAILEGIAVAGGVYGEDRQVATSLARVINNTSTFLPYLQLVVPTRTGTYEIRWRCVVDSSAGADGQVRLYNVTDTQVVGSYLDYSVPLGNLWAVHGEADVVFTGAGKTFAIQMRDKLGLGGIQGIQDLRMTIKRVA